MPKGEILTYQFNQVPSFLTLNKSHPNLKAILWDLDGTIVNTEIAHMEAVVFLLTKECNLDISKYNLEFFLEKYKGISDDHIYEEFLKIIPNFNKFSKNEFLEKKEAYLQLIIKDSSYEKLIKNEIINLISEINQNSIKQVIVTNSNKVSADNILNHLKLTSNFHFILTREDYKKAKPDPYPYQLALSKLNLLSNDVIAFEDSQIGYTSATRANIPTYKVTWYDL